MPKLPDYPVLIPYSELCELLNATKQIEEYRSEVERYRRKTVHQGKLPPESTDAHAAGLGKPYDRQVFQVALLEKPHTRHNIAVLCLGQIPQRAVVEDRRKQPVGQLLPTEQGGAVF